MTTVLESGRNSHLSTSPPPFLVLEKWISSSFIMVSVSIFGRSDIKIRRLQTSESIWQNKKYCWQRGQRLFWFVLVYSSLFWFVLVVLLPPPDWAAAGELVWPLDWCCTLLPDPLCASSCPELSLPLRTHESPIKMVNNGLENNKNNPKSTENLKCQWNDLQFDV